MPIKDVERVDDHCVLCDLKQVVVDVQGSSKADRR